VSPPPDRPARIEALGDAAILVTLAEEPSEAVSAQVAELATALRALGLASMHDVVPAYCAVAVHFDPADDASRVEAAVRAAVTRLAAPGPGADAGGRIHRIPVVYDGPDLQQVARQSGLAVDEVIRRHVGRTYRAHFLGFVPGFAYLGPIDAALVLPRRTEPRRRVPAGSVAIAGAQTGIYPLETPGGWHLLGRTDVVLFDPDREPPHLIAAGDQVRFEAVSA
jgi:KipI family sensor histidine kinase inhibitor